MTFWTKLRIFFQILYKEEYSFLKCDGKPKQVHSVQRDADGVWKYKVFTDW